MEYERKQEKPPWNLLFDFWGGFDGLVILGKWLDSAAQ